jgi:citrate/tricarballylate utilization protein
MFAPVFLFVVFALSMGVRRFWRDVKPATSGADVSGAAARGHHDVLRLKYLDGGHGDGCHNEDDAYTLKRRRFHHLTFYGFMLCFAATAWPRSTTTCSICLRPTSCPACPSCWAPWAA